MVIFKTFTSLTPKQILKAGLIFSLLSSVLIVAGFGAQETFSPGLVNLLRSSLSLIFVALPMFTFAVYVIGYFGEPFVFAYELLTKKIPLAWPTFRPPTPLDIILFAMLPLGIFFVISLKNYLGRERRTLIWWLAAWMTISFFLLPFHSLLQGSEPEIPAGPKEEWRNFKDQEYNFSFRYPNNWLIKKHDEKTTVSVSNYPAGCEGCSETEKQNYYEFYIQDKGILTGEKRTNDASEYLLKERLALEKLDRECQSNSTQPCLPRTPGPQQYIGEPKDLFDHLPASAIEVSPYHLAPDYGENFHLVQNEYVLIDNNYRLYTIDLVSPGYPNGENKTDIKDRHPLVDIIKSLKLE
ncbi:MAG: hypothetical protein Q8N84_04300 [bacterium]|nr:hypothetical protein [bacterium]